MNAIAQWILSPGGTNTLGGSYDAKPTLVDAYAVYMGLFAPLRGSSVIVGTIADFVEVLRQNEKDALYSDEEWISFLLPAVGMDYDKSRDLWDALLCQPSYTQEIE